MNQFSSGIRAVVNHAAGDPLAVVDDIHGRKWTYDELLESVRRWAALLNEIGPAPSPIVSLLPNSAEQLFVFLACLWTGRTFAALPPLATSFEIRRWLSLVDRPIVLVEPSSPNADLDTSLRVIRLKLGDSASLPTNTLEPRPEPGRLVITTGGTTGTPRLIVLNGDRLWQSAESFSAYHRFLAADCRFFNNLPMGYLAGIFNLALIPFAAGASTAIVRPFSGPALLTFWKDVRRVDANILWLTPGIVRGLIRARNRTPAEPPTPSSIKAAFLGMARADLQEKLEFESTFGIPIIEAYGLSETTFLSSERLTPSSRSSGSVGEILPWVEARFSRRGDEGPSELQVRTPFLFEGYLSVPGQLTPATDAHGWFSTGDSGHVETDGTLCLTGRLKDIIKRGGILIALQEVEQIVDACHTVQCSAAVAVASESYGEEYLLFVEPLPTATAADAIREAEARVRECVEPSKWPARIEAVSEMPRSSSSGKVRKDLLPIPDSDPGSRESTWAHR